MNDSGVSLYHTHATTHEGLTFSRVFNVWFCNSNSLFSHTETFPQIQSWINGWRYGSFVFNTCSAITMRFVDVELLLLYHFVWMAYNMWMCECYYLHDTRMACFSTVWSKFQPSIPFPFTMMEVCINLRGIVCADDEWKINSSSQSYVFEDVRHSSTRKRYIIYRRRNSSVYVCVLRMPNKTHEWDGCIGVLAEHRTELMIRIDLVLGKTLLYNSLLCVCFFRPCEWASAKPKVRVSIKSIKK